MESNTFDVRKLPVNGLCGCAVATGQGSFVRNKYTLGRPNNSRESTNRGVRLALERIVSLQDDDAFFGVHIKETIRQIRSLFGGAK